MKNKKSKTSRAPRRLLILACGLLVLVAGGGGWYGYRVHRLHAKIAGWRTEGLAAAQRGDASLAVDRLTSYLTYHPTDREALLAYADERPLVESPDGHQLTDTVRALRYLVQLDPANLPYRVRLLDLYWKLGLRTESAETAGEILKADPDNRRALEVDSSALAGLKRYPEALKASRHLCDLEPANLVAQRLTFALRAASGNTAADVLADVDAWGKHHPDDPARCELLRACAYGAFGDRDNAMIWIRRAAAEPSPDDAFSDVLINELAVAANGTDDIAILKDMISHGAGQRVRQRLLGRLWELGQVAEILDLSKGMNFNDAGIPPHLLAVMSMAYTGGGRTAESDAMRQKLSGSKDAVAAAWTAILEPGASDPKSLRSTESACRQALAKEPAAPYLRYFLGESLAALGEDQLAIEAWQQEGLNSPTWGLPLARAAELSLNRQNPSRAAQLAIIALKRTPTPQIGLVVARVAAAMMQEGRIVDHGVVMNLIDQLDKLLPGNGRVRLLRAQVLASSGQKDEAARLLREFLKADPKQHTPADDALLLQAATISRAEQLGVDAELLARVEQLHGMSPELALDRALSAAAAADSSAGLKVFDELQASAPANQRPPLDWSLARARYLDRTNNPAAPAAWRTLGDGHADNLPVQQAVLAAHAVRQDKVFREQTISRLEALVGKDSLECGLARAELLIDNRASDADDGAIAELLKKIIAAHPTLAEPRALWATHLERAGKISEAIDQIQVALNANPDIAALALKLASLYNKQGDYARARDFAERVVAFKASNRSEVRAAAQLLTELGESAKAVSALEGLSADDQHAKGSSEGGDLMLAGMYWDRGEIDKVAAIVSKALASPAEAAQPDVLAFAARFYASQNKSAELARVMSLIDAKTLPAGYKELIHADTLAASGDGAGAERLYREAVNAAPHDAATWRSLISYLYTAGRAKDAASAVDGALAQIGSDLPLQELKRSSTALAATCQLKEMRPIVQGYLRDPLNQPASAEILSAVARASGEGSSQAIEEARTLSQRYPRIEGVQLWAIRTFLHAARLQDAAPLIGRVMTDFPESAQAAAVAAAFYGSQSKWPEMLDAAQQWQKRIQGRSNENEAERADTAEAQALLELGKAQQALELLKPVVAPCLDHPGKHVEVLSTYARCLAATGQLQSATDLLPQAQTDAPWRQACVQLAAQKLEPSLGSTWLDRLEPWARAASTDELSQVAEAWEILSSRSPGDLQFRQRAETLFSQVEAAPSASAVAIERAGVFAERSGDAAKAISLYRRALALEPRRLVCLNEMACLLMTTGGSLDDAARDAEAAVQIDPAQPEFLDTLAMVKTKAGDRKGAADCLARAALLDPDNLRWPISQAQALLDNGQASDAAKIVAGIDARGIDLTRLPKPLKARLDAVRVRLTPAAMVDGSGPTPR